VDENNTEHPAKIIIKKKFFVNNVWKKYKIRKNLLRLTGVEPHRHTGTHKVVIMVLQYGRGETTGGVRANDCADGRQTLTTFGVALPLRSV